MLLSRDSAGELHLLHGLLLGVSGDHVSLPIDFLFSIGVCRCQVVVGLLKTSETLNNVLQLLELVRVAFLDQLQEVFELFQLLHLLLDELVLLLQVGQLLFLLLNLLLFLENLL